MEIQDPDVTPLQKNSGAAEAPELSMNPLAMATMGIPVVGKKIESDEIERRKREGAPFWCVDCQGWKMQCKHGMGG